VTDGSATGSFHLSPDLQYCLPRGRAIHASCRRGTLIAAVPSASSLSSSGFDSFVVVRGIGIAGQLSTTIAHLIIADSTSFVLYSSLEDFLGRFGNGHHPRPSEESDIMMWLIRLLRMGGSG
jgi:hypothetical protein